MQNDSINAIPASISAVDDGGATTEKQLRELRRLELELEKELLTYTKNSVEQDKIVQEANVRLPPALRLLSLARSLEVVENRGAARPWWR